MRHWRSFGVREGRSRHLPHRPGSGFLEAAWFREGAGGEIREPGPEPPSPGRRLELPCGGSFPAGARNSLLLPERKMHGGRTALRPVSRAPAECAGPEGQNGKIPRCASPPVPWGVPARGTAGGAAEHHV